MDIVKFLQARYDEIEALAKEAADGADEDWCPSYLYSAIRHLQRNLDLECSEHDWGTENEALCGQPDRYAGPHIAFHDPKYVLADIAAKRQLILYVQMLDGQGSQPGGEIAGYHATGVGIAIRFLAQPFTDHPDFNEAWRV